MTDIHAFADPWEHLRLLSDHQRNEALVQLLRRHAPGARVLEAGCGTGLFSLLAARLGAKHVHAVEPTALIEVAKEVAKYNGLLDRISFHEGRLEDLSPQPVDLAFSELLNADPFAEGLLEVSAACHRWLVDGGRLAPRRFRLYGALAQARPDDTEAPKALQALRALAQTFDLRLDPLMDALQQAETYRYVTKTHQPLGPAQLLLDLDLTEAVDLEEEPQTLSFAASSEGEAAGILLWWEAELDDGLTMSNPPATPGHWGNLMCAWPTPVSVSKDQELEVEATIDDEDLEFWPTE